MQKDRIKAVTAKLKVAKRLSGKIQYADTLAALYAEPPAFATPYEKDIQGLVQLMKDEPVCDCIADFQAAGTRLRRQYNHRVDTTRKIMTEEKFAAANKLSDGDPAVPLEIYTTAHLGSAMIVRDFILEALDRRARRSQLLQDSSELARRNPDQQLNSIQEVSAGNELTSKENDLGRKSGNASDLVQEEPQRPELIVVGAPQADAPEVMEARQNAGGLQSQDAEQEESQIPD